MDGSPKPLPDGASAAAETAWQAASSALQMLSMLDVVRHWSLEDADHLTELAEQADQLSFLAASQVLQLPPNQAKRLARALDGGRWRARRLQQAVPTQARDKSSAAAVATALQRLGDALERLRLALGLLPAEGGSAG